MSDDMVHATAVALWCPDGWRGALLRGPSGAGKSDLALRLIADGWRLIGDDYVHVFASGGALFAAPAERIAGRIEARGVGIIPTRHLPLGRLRLIVDCLQHSGDRLPQTGWATLSQVALPLLPLDVRPASAPTLLALAMRRL